MSWLFSQALVEEYLAANSLDGEQFAPLNGSPTPQAYCAPDKMTDFSRLSQFGMMYAPLSATTGGVLLTWYLGGFPVKTSAQQEKAQELMENEVECGDKWRASFVRYDPDSSLWRTHQCLLAGDLDEFLETWPQWGLMRDGECWEQQTLERRIRETEFGLWPTPTKSDGRNWISTFTSLRNPKKSGMQPSEIHPELHEILMNWPIGWTDLVRLEMDKFQQWQQQHGEF